MSARLNMLMVLAMFARLIYWQIGQNGECGEVDNLVGLPILTGLTRLASLERLASVDRLMKWRGWRRW